MSSAAFAAGNGLVEGLAHFNSGYDNFYGLDQAITFLGLEYGINDRLMGYWSFSL